MDEEVKIFLLFAVTWAVLIIAFNLYTIKTASNLWCKKKRLLQFFYEWEGTDKSRKWYVGWMIPLWGDIVVYTIVSIISVERYFATGDEQILLNANIYNIVISMLYFILLCVVYVIVKHNIRYRLDLAAERELQDDLKTLNSHTADSSTIDLSDKKESSK